MRWRVKQKSLNRFWFAWYPVRTVDTDEWIWWEKVWRVSTDGWGGSGHDYYGKVK